MKRTFEMPSEVTVGYAGECSVTKRKLVLCEQLEWYRGITLVSFLEAGVFYLG